jgi:methionine-rich copper-binding protein CopC
VTFSVSDGTASVDATVTVDAHGDWTVDGMDIGALGDGPITMTATAVDVAGNASDPTSGTSALDTVAPGAPGSVAVVDAPITSGSATVTGSGDNGDSASVDVTSDGGSGTASATGGASDGGWSVPVDVSSLADGTLTVTVTETDAAGNVGGTTVVHAYKDTTALAAVATTPADGSFGKNVTELSATYDEQIDLGRSSVTLTDSTGTPLATTDPVLSDDQRTIRVQAVDDQLAEDAYTLTVSVHDKTTESATTVVHFTLDRTPASAPSVGSLGSATATNVTTVPVSGTAPEPNGSLTVSVTDGAATVTKTVALGESTSWATQVDLSSLADGPITATATEADRAGNVSSVSAPISSTKDTVVPAAPAPSLPNVTNANESSVSVSGTGESGDTVNVAVSDGTHDAVTAHAQVADGTWSATLDLSTLSEGTLTVSATQTDGVGNVSDVGTATATKDLSDHSNLTSAVSTSAILVGNSTTLSGALTDTTNTGNIAGARVDIYGQITPSRTYALLASATTGQNGAYSYTVKLARNTMLQARYAGDSNHDSVIGPARWVTVAPKVTVTAPANRATVTANRSVTFTGSVTPNMTGATVALYETHATGNPTLLVSGVVSGSGKFSLKRTSGFKAGSHTVRIVVSATTTNATGFTPIMTLRAK